MRAQKIGVQEISSYSVRNSTQPSYAPVWSSRIPPGCLALHLNHTILVSCTLTNQQRMLQGEEYATMSSHMASALVASI
jgi:hypothetical protein